LCGKLGVCRLYYRLINIAPMQNTKK
jgi:hypothetical protein